MRMKAEDRSGEKGSRHRVAKPPLEQRYFLITDARPEGITRLIGTHSLRKADILYVVPLEDVGMEDIRKAAPKGCTVYDMRRYDVAELKSNAAALGYEVLEISGTRIL